MLLDGRDITDVPANKRDMGMVFQAYSLFPNLTVADNVAFGLRVRAPRQGRAARPGRPSCSSWSAWPTAATATRTSSPAASSSGWRWPGRWRCAPQVLLLDEPLSALDAQVRVQLREEIRRIQLELGITTVFVTHDQDEALSVADRVGVLRGRPAGAGGRARTSSTSARRPRSSPSSSAR